LARVTTPWLVFLDADDWMYPDRLERLLGHAPAPNGLDAVLAPLALTDPAATLVGIRDVPQGDLRRALRAGEVAFAPALYSTRLARAAGFDARDWIAEDVGFAWRAAALGSFARCDDTAYAYSPSAAEREARVAAHLRSARAVLTTGRSAPLTALRRALRHGLGAAAHATLARAISASIAATSRRLAPRRAPSLAERSAHESALGRVDDELARRAWPRPLGAAGR
jgi:hypothetical protein